MKLEKPLTDNKKNLKKKKMVRKRFDKDLSKMEKRTARENVTNNPCLEIFLRTLWADK